MCKNCVACTYFVRPYDAPDCVDEVCMWDYYKDPDDDFEPPCQKDIEGSRLPSGA